MDFRLSYSSSWFHVAGVIGHVIYERAVCSKRADCHVTIAGKKDLSSNHRMVHRWTSTRAPVLRSLVVVGILVIPAQPGKSCLTCLNALETPDHVIRGEAQRETSKGPSLPASLA